MAAALKWKRPVEVGGHTERFSHCGRYKIVKREYVLPSRSFGYTPMKLVEGGLWKKLMRDEEDTLDAAKYWCEADNNPDYDPEV